MVKKANEVTYQRYCSKDNKEKIKKLHEKVKNGELVFAYYAVDNGNGYYYYRVLN